MPRRYWLVKTEPEAFSFDDLLRAPRRTAGWDGVRNYQARNYLRDEIPAGRVEEVSSAIDRRLREAVPDVTEVFLDPTAGR